MRNNALSIEIQSTLTFAHGGGVALGAAIDNEGGNLTLNGCTFSSIAMTKAKAGVYIILATICCVLSAGLAAAQTLQWSPEQQYDDGINPSVALHPSGLVLEFHHVKGHLHFSVYTASAPASQAI